MKKIIALIVVIISLSTSHSQSLLWKVTGKNLQQPSYVYGTIHIQDARVFAFDTNVVMGTLLSCDAFAMEILLDEIDAKAVKNAMYMPKGKMLSKLLSPKDFAKLDSLCKKKIGMSAYLVNTMKPFFVSSMLTQADFSSDQEDALDMYFLKRARGAGKSCYGVEEYQTQVDAIDAISLKEQVKMLSSSLNDTSANDTISDNSKELLQAYLTCDFGKMLELCNDPSMPKKFNRIFLIDRNVGMADHFEEIALKQSVFCAVGAAHLAGDKGVLSLLRKKGYTVEPVIFNWNN